MSCRFVQRQAPRLHPKRAKLMTSALRSFLRYARLSRGGDARFGRGRSRCGQLVDATIPARLRRINPSVAGQYRSATAIGRRDYAIVLLLARLGLRSGEVALLELDDIDWDARTGERPRQGRSAHRPAPASRCRRGDCRVPGTDARAARAVACFCGQGAHPRLSGPQRRWIDRSARAPARRHPGPHPGRASISPWLGHPDVAPRRLADRNRRGVGASQSPDHQIYTKVDLGLTHAGVAVAGRWAMTPLRKAVQEYLRMRRIWDSSCRRPARRYPLSSRSWSSIARPSSPGVGADLGATADERSTGGLGAATEHGPWVCAVSQCDRSPHGNSGGGPVALRRSGRDRICTRTRRSELLRAALTCGAAMNAGSYGPGPTTVCSGS